MSDRKFDFTDPDAVLRWKTEGRRIYTAQQAGREGAKERYRAERIATAMRLLKAWEALPWGAQSTPAHIRDLQRAVDDKPLDVKMLRVQQNERIRERLEQSLQESGTCDCHEPNHKCRCCNAWMALAWIEDALDEKQDEVHQ